MKNFLQSWLKIIPAFRYSCEGLVASFKNERAFRQEIILGVPMMLYAALADFSAIEKIILIGTILLVLAAELLNTAIEAVIARISHDIHPMCKIAKDCGSAAVLMMLILTALSWVLILCSA
jgi:diacylglycerol kinase (ATP)